MTAIDDRFHPYQLTGATNKKSQSLFAAFAAIACFVLFSATSLQAQDAAPKPDKNGWYRLFNGQDFTGWKKSQDHPDTFQVANGEIVAHGERAHLYYAGSVQDHNFKNFEWTCEVMTT